MYVTRHHYKLDKYVLVSALAWIILTMLFGGLALHPIDCAMGGHRQPPPFLAFKFRPSFSTYTTARGHPRDCGSGRVKGESTPELGGYYFSLGP